jgi:hypothetical protein
LTTVVRNRLSNNLCTYVCFIDFKKAFDYINRELLLSKLLKLGINGKIYLAIKNILENTKSCIRLNDKYTEFFYVCNGVRQGDSISSTLFSIFINDLVTDLKSLNSGIDIGTYLLCVLLYADDLILMAPDVQSLQTMLDRLNIWANKWQIEINLDKSKIIHFRTIRQSETECAFHIGGKEVSKVSDYKYLGLILDKNLKYAECAEAMAASASRALGSIISKYKSYRDMGYKTYTNLFNAGVIPILNYCSPVWYDLQVTKLEQIQTRAIRVYLGVHKFAPIAGLFGDMGWLPLVYQRKIDLIKYWNRLINMDDDRLTKKIFIFDWNSKTNKTWCHSVEKVFNQLNMNHEFENMINCEINSITTKIYNLFQENWITLVNSKPKLRFYRMFKELPNQEKYLHINLTPKERSAISQLRFGILPLAIETGRYKSIPLNQRICEMCDDHKVEDEIHVLFHCKQYKNERAIWFRKLELEDKDKNDKTLLLKHTFNHPRQTSKCVAQIIAKRSIILYQRQ